MERKKNKLEGWRREKHGKEEVEVEEGRADPPLPSERRCREWEQKTWGDEGGC